MFYGVEEITLGREQGKRISGGERKHGRIMEMATPIKRFHFSLQSLRFPLLSALLFTFGLRIFGNFRQFLFFRIQISIFYFLKSFATLMNTVIKNSGRGVEGHWEGKWGEGLEGLENTPSRWLSKKMKFFAEKKEIIFVSKTHIFKHFCESEKEGGEGGKKINYLQKFLLEKIRTKKLNCSIWKGKGRKNFVEKFLLKAYFASS